MFTIFFKSSGEVNMWVVFDTLITIIINRNHSIVNWTLPSELDNFEMGDLLLENILFHNIGFKYYLSETL